MLINCLGLEGLKQGWGKVYLSFVSLESLFPEIHFIVWPCDKFPAQTKEAVHFYPGFRSKKATIDLLLE